MSTKSIMSNTHLVCGKVGCQEDSCADLLLELNHLVRKPISSLHPLDRVELFNRLHCIKLVERMEAYNGDFETINN